MLLNIKKDFPIFNKNSPNSDLIYLDNSATTQKPYVVIEKTLEFYENFNSSVHRGAYELSEIATSRFEKTRIDVARFIGAVDFNGEPFVNENGEATEIIFTRGATESINLVAYSWGENFINEGDEIVVSILEHHSNLIPWQQLCLRKNAVLKFIPIDKNGDLDLSEIDKIITNKTKLVAVTAMSNVIGTITPIKKIIEISKRVGAVTLIDGAQSAPHFPVNVRELDCDFFVFSAHKMLGPSGLGVLFGKQDILNKMSPFLYGGNMINNVSKYESTWNSLPHKFEAGTPNIAGVIAFSYALKYLSKIGMKNIFNHSVDLRNYAIKSLKSFPKIKIYGENSNNACAILSFSIDGIHPHDISSILSKDNIAIRAGHHCAKPLMDELKTNSTSRISFYIYNSKEDIDLFTDSLKKVYDIFKIK